MATLTDPAFELGEIAERLAQGVSAPGERYLSGQFGVQAWTTEFVQIIHCIYERVDLVEKIVRRDGIDEEVQSTALDVLRSFRAGFHGDALRQHWNSNGGGMAAMATNKAPLKLLSATVRPHVSYPKLTDEEIAEFLGLIDTYLDELSENSDTPPFVRQAIMDGLTKFQFQLHHMRWMGSAYALDAFRDLMVMYDYMGRPTAVHELDASSALKGLGTILRKVKEAVDTAKSWKESGTAVFETYKLVSSATMPVLLLAQQGGG